MSESKTIQRKEGGREEELYNFFFVEKKGQLNMAPTLLYGWIQT